MTNDDKPFVIDNRPGAGGLLGTDIVVGGTDVSLGFDSALTAGGGTAR